MAEQFEPPRSVPYVTRSIMYRCVCVLQYRYDQECPRRTRTCNDDQCFFHSKVFPGGHRSLQRSSGIFLKRVSVKQRVVRYLWADGDLYKYLMKKITISLVSTHIMMADDKTKVVDREKFFRCRNYQMGHVLM